VSHSVALNWTPSTSSYVGFNVYRGSLSGGPYNRANSALISSTSFSDAGVASGQTYYYVATEVDSTGAESVYSSEVIATIP
jgi:fibronectin type 3 domain-containing protein